MSPPSSNHPPHDVTRLDPDALVEHLRQHAYEPTMTSGATRAFLMGLHDRAHCRRAVIAPPDEGDTPAALAGGVERLFLLLTATLRDLDTVDHSLCLDLTRSLADRLLRRFVP